jgi:hypothetical protein
VHLIAAGKTFHYIVLVLPDAFHKVAGNTKVKGAIPLACKHVDARLSPIHGGIPTGFLLAQE